MQRNTDKNILQGKYKNIHQHCKQYFKGSRAYCHMIFCIHTILKF